jgi:hypothetical protein
MSGWIRIKGKKCGFSVTSRPFYFGKERTKAIQRKETLSWPRKIAVHNVVISLAQMLPVVSARNAL